MSARKQKPPTRVYRDTRPKIRHQAGQRVYVQLRVWDSERHKIRHVKGSTIVFEKMTPAEVYALIVEAGRARHDAAAQNRRANGEEAEAGEGNGNRNDDGAGADARGRDAE